jgi:Ca2+/Na+ antiporter
MKKTVLRYGLFGLSLMVLLLFVVFLVFRNDQRWEIQEVIGYVTIVLSLIFVYSGIRHWRDNHNSGNLSFGQGLKLGTLITLFPAIGFGLFTWLQVSVLDPDFNDRYYAHYLEKVKASTPPHKLEETIQKLQAEKEMFGSPLMQFGLMFLTVFLIGIVITVISSLILQKRNTREKVIPA